jgi:hypothetical protein
MATFLRGIGLGVVGAGIGVGVWIGVDAGARAEVATAAQPLLGPVEQADDCTPELQRFNEEIMVYGRTTASTAAFEQCVDREVRARYRKCIGDPYYGSPVATQIARVIAASRSPAAIQITCSGGSGNASTGLGWYNNPGEGFAWGGWFTSVHRQIGRPLCGPGKDPDIDHCRFAAMPWPYSQAAGIVWHEVMHTQGYTHGDNDQANAKIACGYANDASWNFQQNTMPYVLGSCVYEVITRSAARCGDVQACPGSNQLRLLDSYDGDTCSCANDPGKKGLGILGLRGGKLVDRAIVPEEDWIGGWHYGRTNTIRATGDFNGDRRADLVISSGWGLGLLTHGGAFWRALVVKPNGTRLGGWNLNAGGDRIVGVGDFNGDAKDDLVLTSGWGIGVLRHSGASLTHLMMAPTGTNFGGWNFNVVGDRLHGVGDFNGDGKADLLISSAWGLGVLTLSGSTLTKVTMAPSGARLGDWNYSAANDVIGRIADFDGDGKDDVLITSDWGIGVLTLKTGAFTHLAMHASGAQLGAWTYAKTDQVWGTGDFNGDGRADLLIRNSGGLALLGWTGSGGLRSMTTHKGGASIDGWSFNASGDLVVPVVDLDGDGRDELLIRSGWGTGLLRREPAGALRLIDAQPNAGLFGSWPIGATDKIAGVDRFLPGDAPAHSPRGGILVQR